MTLYHVLAAVAVGIAAAVGSIFVVIAFIFPNVRDDDDDTPHGDTTGWKAD